MRRTFIAETGETQILVTLYDDGLTVAFRSWADRTWGPPIIARETTEDDPQ